METIQLPPEVRAQLGYFSSELEQKFAPFRLVLENSSVAVWQAKTKMALEGSGVSDLGIKMQILQRNIASPVAQLIGVPESDSLAYTDRDPAASHAAALDSVDPSLAIETPSTRSTGKLNPREELALLAVLLEVGSTLTERRTLATSLAELFLAGLMYLAILALE